MIEMCFFEGDISPVGLYDLLSAGTVLFHTKMTRLWPVLLVSDMFH